MERWCPWCAIQNICGTLHPDNATRPCRGPWKYYFHGFLRKLLWIPWGPHGIPWESHGIPWVFNKIPWNPIRFLGDPGGIPSDPNGGSKFQVGNTAFLWGGGKSGKKIEGAATHFDHAAKLNSSKYLWGHCRVATGVLSMVKGRWAFLPLLQDNNFYQ